MIRTFLKKRTFSSTRGISEAAHQEAKQALKEIKKLGASDNLDDLSRALVLISDAEKKYPVFQNTAYYCRAMSKHPDSKRGSHTAVKPSHILRHQKLND
jgi:hypothetical protein